MRFLERCKALEKDVLRKIPKVKLLYAPRREVMISIDDELRLLKAVEHADDTRRYQKCEPAPLREVFTIMLDCGMRPSEVVTMRREQVDVGGSCVLQSDGQDEIRSPSNTAQ